MPKSKKAKPKKKPFDEPTAKKLYFENVPLKDIADQLGVTVETVKQRIKRGKWKDEKEALRHQVDAIVLESVKSDLEGIKNKLLDEYQRIAFSSISDFIEWDGKAITLKSMQDLPPEATRCISEIVVNKDGSVRLKLHNKQAALDSLAKILQMFDKEPPDPNVGQGGEEADPGIDPLLEALEASAETDWGNYEKELDNGSSTES